MEAVNSAINPQSMDANQVPPNLLSLIIEGLPPMEQSKYIHEAEKLLAQNTARWQNVSSYDSFCRLGLAFASYMLPGAINADRLVTIGIHYGCVFVLDDLFYDLQDEVLAEEYGVDRSVFESPRRIQEYIEHLMAVHSQQKAVPSQAAPLEVIFGELGHHILQLSNPEYFEVFIASLREHYQASADSHAEIVVGQNSCVQDLELYTAMRAKNVAGEYAQLCGELATNIYLPRELRAHPFMQKLLAATSVHLGFANDIYSFPKESTNEATLNPRNLVTLFMTSGGLPLVEAMHEAIAVTNKYARTVVDSEAEAWTSALQQYIQDLKALIAGNVYFGCISERYIRPDSIFVEQRNACVSA